MSADAKVLSINMINITKSFKIRRMVTEPLV